MDEFAADARPWLEQSSGDFGAIFVDAYRQPYIPFYLATREFFELARDRLAPGGSVIVNIGHPPGSDNLERVIGRTMAAVFPSVQRYPVTETNTMLVGSAAPISGAAIGSAVPPFSPQLKPAAEAAAHALGAQLRGGEVYTDDRAPVEWLIDASLFNYAER